jgi:pilus assembly protein CpaC
MPITAKHRADRSAQGIDTRGKSMKRRFTATMLLASLVAMPLAMVPVTSAQAQSVRGPAQDLSISIGRGTLVTVPGSMADVFVADDKVADVQVKSQRQLYVFGKAGGETTIYASNARGDVIWSANIRVGNNISSVDQMLSLAMPEAKVSVATMGTNTVLLTGTVAAPEDAAEAERLVSAFLGDEANVISRLKTATPLQVNLQVRFAEVSRTLLRNMGGSLTTFDGSSGFRFGIGNGRTIGTGDYSVNGPVAVGSGVQNPAFVLPDGTRIPGPGVNTTGSGATLGALGKFLGLDILGALDLAETQGLVTTLSTPNLTALSGETADFLAGGEFPIPTSQGLGATAIEYRNYGVSLTYTPTVLANGRISLRVRPEISELSNQGAVVVDGFSIPALTTRRAETTVELGSGQSFMIAGLMSNNSQKTIEKAPGAGDIPILGNLFRSRSFRKGETELVIVVTPYLVKPVNASDIKLPTDGFRSANESQQLVGFRDHAGASGASRPVPTVRDTTSAAPSVSAATPQGSDEQKQPRQAVKPSSPKDRRTDTPAPGFSI